MVSGERGAANDEEERRERQAHLELPPVASRISIEIVVQPHELLIEVRQHPVRHALRAAPRHNHHRATRHSQPQHQRLLLLFE